MSNTKAVKNSNMEEIMRIAMELCRRDLEELIREFGEEKVVEILENNMKILEMQLQIKKLENKEKENRGEESTRKDGRKRNKKGEKERKRIDDK